MAGLFDSTLIKAVTLPNRFVRSATWEGLADEGGFVTPELVEYMRVLGRGGLGLIISGHAYVSPEGKAGLRQMAACSDDHIEGLAALAEAAHQSGTPIVLQLAHAGDQANTQLSGLPAVGPADALREGHLPTRALDAVGIARTVEAFAQAARRGKLAGYDGVQIHAAHGYLLSQFLTPAWNPRTDAYGGSRENRARLLMEVVAAVRRKVGPDYPVLVKMNAADFVENGVTPEDAAAVALMLEKASVDAVEFSGGGRQAGEKRWPARKGPIRSREDEAYYRDVALLARKRLSIPLMLVGGVRSLEVAEDLLASGAADYISLCRPLICEPGLVARWKGGDTSPALCVRDNACYGPGFAGEGVRCVTFEKKRAGG